MATKKHIRASLAKEVQKSMKARELELEDLLKTLKEERNRYNKLGKKVP